MKRKQDTDTADVIVGKKTGFNFIHLGDKNLINFPAHRILLNCRRKRHIFLRRLNFLKLSLVGLIGSTFSLNDDFLHRWRDHKLGRRTSIMTFFDINFFLILGKSKLL